MSDPAMGAAGPFHLHGVVLPGGARRDVFIVDGRVRFQYAGDAITLATDGWILPGLVDMHAHLAVPHPEGPPADPVGDAIANARVEMNGGVLAIREPGNPWRSGSDLGPHRGTPRVVTAGRWIAAPGRFVPGGATFASGDELVASALAELQLSQGWVKIVGDWVGPDGDLTPSFTADELVEVVEAVAAAGGRVAVHAADLRTVEAAVDAGVASIEHGVGITSDLLGRMAATGIVLVPTLLATSDVGDSFRRRGATPETVARVVSACRRHPEMVREAVEAGVQVFVGTDAGLVPRGLIGEELRLMATAGVPAATLLAAASWDARAFLGLPGIEEGAPADLMVVSEDPRSHPAALRNRKVMLLDGRPVDPTGGSATS